MNDVPSAQLRQFLQRSQVLFSVAPPTFLELSMYKAKLFSINGKLTVWAGLFLETHPTAYRTQWHTLSKSLSANTCSKVVNRSAKLTWFRRQTLYQPTSCTHIQYHAITGSNGTTHIITQWVIVVQLITCSVTVLNNNRCSQTYHAARA